MVLCCISNIQFLQHSINLSVQGNRLHREKFFGGQKDVGEGTPESIRRLRIKGHRHNSQKGKAVEKRPPKDAQCQRYVLRIAAVINSLVTQEHNQSANLLILHILTRHFSHPSKPKLRQVLRLDRKKRSDTISFVRTILSPFFNAFTCKIVSYGCLDVLLRSSCK